jgi:hopanoid biosynthesis associated RND transporter like protein HpnN
METIAPLYRRALVRLVDGVRRTAGLSLFVLLALTVAAGWYSATHLAINTDTSDMLSPDLEFRRQGRELSRAFPQFSDNLLVVVDGVAPDLVDDAARRLSDELRNRPSVFSNIFDLPDDPYFRRNGLLYLDLDELTRLSDRLAEAQPFLGVLWRDPSLRGLFNMLGLAADEAATSSSSSAPIDLVAPLSAIADVVEGQLDHRFSVLSWRRLMQGADDSPNRRLIVVQPVLNFNSLNPADEAMEAVRSLAVSLGLDADHGVRVRLTGSAALDQEELDSVGQGMGLAALISLVMVVVLHLIGLGSWRLATGTVLAMICGLIWTAAFAFFAIGTLNLISVAFAVLFIGLSEDFGIHLALRYREEIDRRVPHDEALRVAAEADGGSITLCAVCAAIAFLSFVPTDYRGLAELGIIAGVGMFIAVLANMTVLPAVISLLRPRPRRLEPHAPDAVERSETYIMRHGRTISFCGFALFAAALLFAPRIEFDFDPLNLKDPTTESVQTLFDVMSDPQTSPYNIEILAPNLAEADALAKRLEALPEVKEALTLSDYVPKDQEEKLDIIQTMGLFLTPAFEAGADIAPPSGEELQKAEVDLLPKLEKLSQGNQASTVSEGAARLRTALMRLGTGQRDLEELERRLMTLLPERIDALRESLEAGPVALAGLPADLRARQIAADGRARIDVYPRDDVRDRKALKRFVNAVRTVAPHAAGTPVTILEAGNAVVKSFAEATILSVGLILLLLGVLLRNMRDMAMVFAPLLLAAALTGAASVLLGLPFNFANVIVLPLLFGLGVANGIHYVTREHHETDVEAMMATSTPRAVTLSALTTIGSFASMALSSHRGTAGMGILLTIAIGLALVATLIFLPGLMSWIVPKKGTHE